ncbi:MAG: sulfopyruvate decarboxylase subunit alpha [Methanocorpusculum sp.]|nr:sulfopyruvate decarboxylase subunit alpha [Methanocorpusculum sp.]
MNEEAVIRILKDAGVEFAVSLPCDKNKRFTAMLPDAMHTVTLAREEDGVGICSGLALCGRRAVLSIQSSGIGNMMNALMSLTSLYNLPLPVLASWRGVCNEAICAQIPFNEPLPKLLDVYKIPYRIIGPDNISDIAEVLDIAFNGNTPAVALILPSCWGDGKPTSPVLYSPRNFSQRSLELPACGSPKAARKEAIEAFAAAVPADALVISNIGVPSKELYAANDRNGNFYMLGSYMQASALGLGCALGCPKKQVYVLDGDGSLLGSAVLPVAAAEQLPNLHIIALDNGTFGSTGNQKSPAYAVADIGLMALAAGISDVVRTNSPKELPELLDASFVHMIIKPGNSDAVNIPLSPQEIRMRFMLEIGALKNDMV